MANCRLDQRQRPHVLCRIVEGWFSIRRRASESSAAFAGPAAIGPCSGEVPINPFHRISRDVDWLALYHAPSAASGWGFSFGGPGGALGNHRGRCVPGLRLRGNERPLLSGHVRPRLSLRFRSGSTPAAASVQDGPPLIAGDHAAEMVGDRLIVVVVMSGTPNPAAVSPAPAAWCQEKAPALESNRGHPTQEKKLSVEVMLETPSGARDRKRR